MDFEHKNVRMVVKEDRLSILPDDLIHQILSKIDIKFVVQMSCLSSRWKLLWTSIPHLNFYNGHFNSLPKFSKFVTHVLSHRNPQIEVSSIKLYFDRVASQVSLRKIANYAFSHNVKKLSVFSTPDNHHKYPLCLFSSQSLEHLTLGTYFLAACVTPKSPWNFPALTTLYLSEITLCDHATDGQKSIDLFSKCVNLKNLTLKRFLIKGVEVLDIITPRLSNLTLINGTTCPRVVNLVATQLENLTIIHCGIKYISAPPGLASLCYIDWPPLQLSTDGFHSLGKVILDLPIYSPHWPYKEEDAHKTINMLQELHSSTFLTLNTDIVECLSLFPNLLSHRSSPFGNLQFLKIEYKGSKMRKDAHKITMSTQVRNFFLENSPSATFVMELPEEPPTKAMKQKEARAKKMAKQREEIECLMAELQLLMEQGKDGEIERAEKKAKQEADFVSLMAELEVLLKPLKMQSERTQTSDFIEPRTEGKRAEVELVFDRIMGFMEEMYVQLKQDHAEIFAILSKKIHITGLLIKLPKRQRVELEARYPQHMEKAEARVVHLRSELRISEKAIDNNRKTLSDFMSSTRAAICSSELPSTSQQPPLNQEP